MSRLVGAVMAVALVAASLVAQDTKFELKCKPFNEDSVRQPFDDLCNEGKTKDLGTMAQDVVKDNFCAVGTPITIDIPTLKKLQTEVESPSVLGPQYQPPTDRSKLKNLSTKAPDGTALGEGRLVQMVTFIFGAHYSDVQSGESVNCKLAGNENNDIHVALVGSPGEKDECQSVTTEITPHYRPAVWTDNALNALKGRPVRVTGQLFFDASHHPGSGSNCQPPRRQSSWEIHPLYKLEVCGKTTLEECKVNDNAAWLSLSAFNKQPPTADGKKKDEGLTSGSPTGQNQWEATLAYPYAKGDGKLSVRYKNELVNLKVDEKALGDRTVSDLANFSEGDTIWLRVNSDRTSATKIDCVPVPGGERLVALVVPAIALILLTITLSWGGALNFLMGVDGNYSKSKFQLAAWFGVLVVTYLATYWLRWRYGSHLGGIGIPAHLALISGISAFTFAAAKSIAVTKKGQNGGAVAAAPNAAAGAGGALPAPPAAPAVAPPKGAANRWKFIRDLLSDDAGNAELGDYQMLVIVLIAVGTYLFQAYHFLGTIGFADVKLPDVDTTILAAFGLGQGAYLGNKVATGGKP